MLARMKKEIIIDGPRGVPMILDMEMVVSGFYRPLVGVIDRSAFRQAMDDTLPDDLNFEEFGYGPDMPPEILAERLFRNARPRLPAEVKLERLTLFIDGANGATCTDLPEDAPIR